MKICPKCHTIYSNYAAACPKCGITEPPVGASSQVNATERAEIEKSRVQRDWIWIAVGLPMFIALLYTIVWAMKVLA